MALQSNTDFPSIMFFYHSALLLDLPFQILILHLLISVCTQFHHLFFDRPLCRLPWRFLLNTWLTFLLLSILLTRPIQFKRHILTNERKSKSSKSCNISSLYRCLQLSCILFPPDIIFKTLLSKVASRLAISLFKVQYSTPYVATGLINVWIFFYFSVPITVWLFSKARSAKYAVFAFIFFFQNLWS